VCDDEQARILAWSEFQIGSVANLWGLE